MTAKRLEERITLSKTLMKETSLSLLKELFQNPDRDLSIRNLSKKADVSYVTTRKFVSKLLTLGLLKEERKSNSRFISLNKKSPYYETLRRIIKMDTGPLRKVAKEYAEEVAEKIKEVEKIILYGSVERGDPTLTSDVDILILVEGETKEPESLAGKIADKYQRKQGVNISPLVETIEEYETGLKEEGPFYQAVESSKEILYGDANG